VPIDKGSRKPSISNIMDVAQDDLDRAIETLNRAATATVVSIGTLGEWITITLLQDDTLEYRIMMFISSDKGAIGLVKGGEHRLTYVGLVGKVMLYTDSLWSEIEPGRVATVRNDHKLETERGAKVLVILTKATGAVVEG
jgi:hypothetical protein